MSVYGNAIMLGGGGLKATDALLRVQAPAGSTVTITKGGTTKTDLGHENADDHTVYDYYFIIHQSQFDSQNAWTVTATLGTDTASDTITISAADEYDVILVYGFYLYRNGVIETTISGGLVDTKIKGSTGTKSLTNTNNTLVANVTYSSGNDALSVLFGTVNKIDLTDYSTLHIIMSECSFYTGANNYRPRFGVLTATPSGDLSNWSFAASESITSNISSATEITVDVSALTSSCYVGLGLFAGSQGTKSASATITQLWLTE